MNWTSLTISNHTNIYNTNLKKIIDLGTLFSGIKSNERTTIEKVMARVKFKGIFPCQFNFHIHLYIEDVRYIFNIPQVFDLATRCQ